MKKKRDALTCPLCAAELSPFAETKQQESLHCECYFVSQCCCSPTRESKDNLWMVACKTNYLNWLFFWWSYNQVTTSWLWGYIPAHFYLLCRREFCSSGGNKSLRSLNTTKLSSFWYAPCCLFAENGSIAWVGGQAMGCCCLAQCFHASWSHLHWSNLSGFCSWMAFAAASVVVPPPLFSVLVMSVFLMLDLPARWKLK